MLTLTDIIGDFEICFYAFCGDEEGEKGVEVTEINGYTVEDMADLARDYLEDLEQDYAYYGAFTYDPEKRLENELY